MFDLVWNFAKAVFANPIPLIVFAVFAYWTGWANGSKGRGFLRPTWPWAALLVLVALSATTLAAQPRQSPRYRRRAGWILPDSSVTPGAVRTTDAKKICHGTTKTVRHTTQATKEAVYAEYGITNRYVGQYEIDHLIPLELGGADTVANLWPEPAKPLPGFHQKDILENWLHAEICSGALTPDSAQRWIVRDFPGAYRAMVTAKAREP